MFMLLPCYVLDTNGLFHLRSIVIILTFVSGFCILLYLFTRHKTLILIA
jgi:hypothetical protein